MCQQAKSSRLSQGLHQVSDGSIMGAVAITVMGGCLLLYGVQGRKLYSSFSLVCLIIFWAWFLWHDLNMLIGPTVLIHPDKFIE